MPSWSDGRRVRPGEGAIGAGIFYAILISALLWAVVVWAVWQAVT